MNEKLKCESCNFSYRADKNERCPYCGWNPKADPDLAKGMKVKTQKPKSNWSQFAPPAPSKASSQPSSPESDSATIAELIHAQNRTTAAVRSLAVFFFYNLFWGAIVGLLVLIASALPPVRDCDFYDGCTNATNPASIFLLVLAAIAAIAGIWITMASAIKELRASRTTQTFM